jgi:hygromycin-B 7''-O-kinase
MTMPLLPAVDSGQALTKLLANAAIWPAALEAIRERHHLGPGAFQRASKGSFAIFFLGDDLVVKLVANRWRSQYEGDRTMLPLVFGKLRVPTPQLIAAGDLDDWGYLVMTRLPGRSLGDVWRTMERAGKLDLADQIGGVLSDLHALPAASAAAIAIDWPRFLEEQARTAASRHAAKGAPEAWTRDIDAYLAPLVEPLSQAAQVPLSADITDDNVLVEERCGRIVLSGLIDFGDALVGDALYDFVSPVTFFGGGSPDILSALLAGYGYESAPRDLRQRMRAYSLLHRFADLARDAARIGAAESSTLGDVLGAIYPD